MTTWTEYELASPREKDAIATEWYIIWHQYSLDSELAKRLYLKHCNARGPLRRQPKPLTEDYEFEDKNWEAIGDKALEWGR